MLFNKERTTLICAFGSQKTYNIPSSVTSIGEWAFSGCSSLTSLNIPSSVTSIGELTFWGCSSLTSINIPSSVTYIGSQAFTYCSSLTSINIPSSVTSIGSQAFSDCISLTSINIPSSVTNIGEAAFSGCSALTALTVDANNPNYCVDGCMLLNKEKTTLICAFGSQKTYNIPSSVTCIGTDAFWGCSSLTSINIPSSVTSIERSAFSYCTALTAFTVDANNPNYCADGCMLFNKEKTTLICASGSQKTYNIPSSVTSICEFAFYGCSALTSINIPSSVISIGVGAFYGCYALKVALIQSNRIDFRGNVILGNTNIYAISDNNFEIHLVDYYEPDLISYVNDELGGTWYTYDTPNIYDRNGSAISSDKWSGNKLDYNSGQYLKTILETSTNAQTFILNNNAIYNKLSEDIRKNLEDNLKKIDDLANIIAAGDAALSDLSTNLSNAYNDVRNAVTGIEHATTTSAATLRVYDLNGRRINVNHVDELPQGIYVINGKKVIR